MLISIAMATYNGEKFIRQQLDSILLQSFADFELIICDDCSYDVTVEIIKQYQQKDSRINLYQNEKNLGFKKNFEKIISLCKGDYIALCDQDDIWTKDHLEILLKEIKSFDCVSANALLIDEKGESIGITMRDFIPIHLIPKDRNLLFRHEVYGNIVQGAASMFSRDLLMKALPIPDSVKYHDWWFALIACEYKGCKYIDKIVLNYRRHESNATQCPAFGIKEAIKLLFGKSDVVNRRISYSETDAALAALLNLQLHEKHIKIATTAQKFYHSLATSQSRIWAFTHYISHYDQIQLDSRKRLFPFVYRSILLLLRGIKL